MALTARMARSRTPYFRLGASPKSYQNTGNALFTGPFHYINPCIKNVVLIDPPYNTGGDFVYPDDFSDSIENYKRLTGQVDAKGNILADALRPTESAKIRCGEKHFAALGQGAKFMKADAYERFIEQSVE